MRCFELHRDRDATGVSGTGVVAEGVQFGDGTAAMRWRGALSSTAAYASMADLEAIHGHQGATRVVYTDPGGGRLDAIRDEVVSLSEHFRRGLAYVAPELHEERWNDFIERLREAFDYAGREDAD